MKTAAIFKQSEIARAARVAKALGMAVVIKPTEILIVPNDERIAGTIPAKKVAPKKEIIL